MGLRLADYVVNECGFAADLGAEKYFDIVMQQSGIVPSAAVLVTTVRSMKNQGEGDLERGLPNLGKHIEILKNFGVPIVAAINRFPDDSESDLKRLAAYCGERDLTAALSEGYAKGGPGAKELAEKVIEIMEKRDRKSTRLNSSHGYISYAVFCLKKKQDVYRSVEHDQKTDLTTFGQFHQHHSQMPRDYSA